MNCLFEVSVLNGNTPVTLRMARSGVSPAGTQLDGRAWTPLITEHSSISGSWVNDGIFGQASINHDSLKFRMSEVFENEHWSAYEWVGGTARIFYGEDGAPFSEYRQEFEGTVSSLDRDGIIATVGLLGPDELLNVDLLTADYNGTGGSEGELGLKGKFKPRAFGNCISVDPVLIDTAHWIYQVHAYGPVQAISVYEFAQALDPAKNKGNTPTYGTLAALALNPGEWATCLSEGMFRLGGTPTHKVSADVLVGGATTIATIIPQLLDVAGIPAGKRGSFANLGSAWSLYQTDQISVGEVARSAVYQAGGVLFADGTGTWQAMDYTNAATPVTLNADRSSMPLVKAVKELPAGAPVWKVRVGHSRCWNVHNADEISPFLTPDLDLSALQDDLQTARDELAEAQSDITASATRITSISSDSVLDRSEKPQVQREFADISADRQEVGARADTYGISRSAMDSAVNALSGYLDSLGIYDTSADVPIVRDTFQARFRDARLATAALAALNEAEAAKRANWANVSGPGRPADNATRNEDAGNLIPDPFTLDGAYYEHAAYVEARPDAQARRRAVLVDAANSTVRWCQPTAIRCYPGETLFYRHFIEVNVSTVDRVNASVSFLDAAGNSFTAYNLSDQTQYGPSAQPAGRVEKRATFTVPANAYFVQPYAERPTWSVNGTFYVDQPYLGRSEPGATYGAPGDAPWGDTTAQLGVNRVKQAEEDIATIAKDVEDIIKNAETIDTRYESMEVMAGAGNLLSNTDFAVIDPTGAVPGWTFNSNNFDVHQPRGRNTLGESYRPLPENTLGAFENVYNGDYFIDFISDWVPVQGDAWIQVSAYIATQRCPAQLHLQWGNEFGAVADTNIIIGDAPPGGASLNDFSRRWMKGKIPPGYNKARLVVSKLGGTSNDNGATNNSWMWFTRPMLALATADLSQPSAYRPGGGLATTDHLNARVTSAATVAAGAAGAAAQIRTELDATTGNGIGARLTSVSQVAARADDRTSGARWSLEAIAGNGRSMLTVYAIDPGNGQYRSGIDMIGDVTFRGQLDVSTPNTGSGWTNINGQGITIYYGNGVPAVQLGIF